MNNSTEIEISVSKVTCMTSCRLAWKFRYIDKLPTYMDANLLLGQAVHHALASFFTHKISTGSNLSMRDLLELYNNAYDNIPKAQEVRFDKDEDPLETKIKGLNCLTLYHPQAIQIKPLAVEQFFSFMIPGTGIKFRGYFDLLTEDDWVLDYKVIAKAYPSDVIQKSLQMQAYDYAFRATTGKLPKGLSYQCMVKTKVPRIDILSGVPHTKETLDRFLKLSVQVAKDMQSGNYYPSESPMNCSKCSYKDACERWHL